MKTNFESKIYPGRISRPRVETKFFENEKIYSISTSWGSSQALEYLQQIISENFLTLRDEEATHTGVTSANHQDKNFQILKALLNKTNTDVLNRFNKEFYTTACESLVLLLNDYHVTWAQVGQPAVFLFRNGQIQILQAARDLSADYSMEAPLPAQLLGVSTQFNFNYQNFLSQKGDVFIFFNGTRFPSCLTSPKKKDRTDLLSQLFNSAAKENPQNAFWLGTLFID